MTFDTIKQHLQDHIEDRHIARKNKITRQYILERYSGLKMVLSDSEAEAMINDILLCDRNIRLVKQKHPELKGNTEEEKKEYEEKALIELGYRKITNETQ